MLTKSEEPASTKKLPLYLGNSLESLEALVRREDTVGSITNIHRLPPVLRKLKQEILNQLHDQEKCFLLSKRFIYMVEMLYEKHEDRKFVESMFGMDYEKIKNILVDITLDLHERYLLGESDLSDTTVFGSGSSPSSIITDPGDRVYIKPSRSIDCPMLDTPRSSISADRKDPDKIKFKDCFIKPAELQEAILCLENLLIVDIRLPSEYEKCRIIIEAGIMINIPADLIVQGDSANTLGKKLDVETQLIWDRRETFQRIVLVDDNTTKYDFMASKLALLRNLLTEWDINKTYHQEPVVLNGGIREFIEWYPTFVNDRPAYLANNCNLELEELLDIESIVYPEPGTTSGPKNVKKFSVQSIGHLHQRIIRDFGPAINEGDGDAQSSRSEGELPADMYESQEVPPGAFESTSEPILTSQMTYAEEIPDITAEYPEVVVKKPKFDEESENIDIIEESRDILLREARAVKPQAGIIETMIFEPSTPEQQDVTQTTEDMDQTPSEAVITREDVANALANIAGKPIGDIAEQPIADIAEQPIADNAEQPIADNAEQPMAEIAAKPIFDRTKKPPITFRTYECPGDGFTSLKNLRNICYMNTILQCLKVIPIMKRIYVTSNLYKIHTTRKPPLINYDFANVLQELWKGKRQEKRSFLIREFKAKLVQINPSYDSGNHEDAFEFFTFLFTHVSQDCEYDIKKPGVLTDSQRAWITHLGGRSSFYVDLFFYQMKNIRKCRKCHKVNLSFETDSTLMLSLPEHWCTLESLVWDYLKDCRIPDFACTRCKTIGSLYHKKQIILTPDVLVIVLKRYRMNEEGRVTKNRVPIMFPKTNLKFGNSLYKLYAIPQHVGTTDAGHYFTTVLLNDNKDEWWNFNDDSYERGSPSMADNRCIGSNSVGFFYVKIRDVVKNCDKY